MIVDTQSDFRWGFIQGITLGIRLGIRLERHPPRPAETQVGAPARGSAGIPDSLARKPVNTSGPTGRSAPSAGLPRSRFPAFFVVDIPCLALLVISYFFVADVAARSGSRLRSSAFSHDPDLRKHGESACENTHARANFGTREMGVM